MTKSLRSPTSISMNVVLWREFRKTCIDLDKKYSDVIEEMMRAWVEENKIK